MTNEQYLLIKGWKLVKGSFIGSDDKRYSNDKWYDPFGIEYDYYGVLQKNSVSSINEAVKIQLDRDAEIRDFVDLHRPKSSELK